MRRVGPEQTVAEQKRRADHRVADQHDAKLQGADVCTGVIFIVIAPAALAKVNSPEASGSSPKPTCSCEPTKASVTVPKIVTARVTRTRAACRCQGRKRPAQHPWVVSHFQCNSPRLGRRAGIPICIAERKRRSER